MSEQLHQVTVTVNGVARRARPRPAACWRDFLRMDLGLTGTHLGCEHGVCGACTVLLDGVPVRSCLIFAVSADGHSVTTVEGCCDAGGELGPVQQAFQECHGLQCGFCTPGFITTISAYLEENPKPDRGGGARGDRRQPVPLHRLPEHRRRSAPRRGDQARAGGAA